MALTSSFTSYPIETVSPNFHLVLEFSRAIDPTTLVGTDFRLRRETGQFYNPGNNDLDFYTTDNITFLIVFHASSLISATSNYLIRLPMNRIEYQDDDDNTQTGPDLTVNTPHFRINPSFGDITPTITYSVLEGEVGTAATAIITFLQPVSGVDISDFSIVNGTLGSDVTAVSATEYEVEVTPIAGDGTLTLTFAEDGTYEGNAEASEDLPYTDVVTAPPPPVTDAVLDMSVNPQSVTAGGIATVTFTFDKSVGDFTDVDVNVSAGATKGVLTDEGNNIWTMPVTAPSSGSGTVTVSVAADVVAPGNNADSVQFAYTAPPPPPPMLTTPGAPTHLTLTQTHNSITANWGAPSNTGGENPSRYDIRIDGGGWIDTGLDLTRTFDSLSPNTEHTIDVAAVNSEGRGTPASSTITTDPAPLVVTAPGAPTSLSFTATHNSIVAMWGVPADNGNEDPSRYDIRIDGGGWIDTGLGRYAYL